MLVRAAALGVRLRLLLLTKKRLFILGSAHCSLAAIASMGTQTVSSNTVTFTVQ